MLKRQFNQRKNKPYYRSNHEITAKEVRLLDEEGEMIGVVSVREALKQAEEQDLDLVEISASSKPPVCRIIDYGKFIYQEKKKEAKKTNKVVHLKEIKMRPKTDVHDYNFKVKHVRQFIEHGDKVKITIRFKGREIAFIDFGKKQIDKVIADTKDIAKVEVNPRMEGKNLFMILAPTVNKESKEKVIEVKSS